jgi:hypothetical protein
MRSQPASLPTTSTSPPPRATTTTTHVELDEVDLAVALQGAVEVPQLAVDGDVGLLLHKLLLSIGHLGPGAVPLARVLDVRHHDLLGQRVGQALDEEGEGKGGRTGSDQSRQITSIAVHRAVERQEGECWDARVVGRRRRGLNAGTTRRRAGVRTLAIIIGVVTNDKASSFSHSWRARKVSSRTGRRERRGAHERGG